MSIQSLSLYVHIPFCSTRCGYCHFNTYEGLDRLFTPFAQALCAESGQYADALADQWIVQTIFIGGGTPTHLPIACFEQIVHALKARWPLTEGIEITAEANPSFITQAYLERMRAAGVNRISFGAQSFDNTLLHMLDREHDAAQIGLAVRLARAAGFENLSLDLMYGLPSQSLSQWRDSLEAALALAPEHLSLYGLTIDDGTAFKKRVEWHLLPEPDPDLAADMYIHAEDRLAQAGYVQYEISNWARKTDDADAQTNARPLLASRHNLTYWLNEPYLGFGPGAHSWFARERYWNANPPQEYVDRLAAGASVIGGRETIDEALEQAETVILGLRLNAGLSRARFAQRFGMALDNVFGAPLAQCAKWDLLTDDGERVRLTPRGRLLSNEVFVRLLPD